MNVSVIIPAYNCADTIRATLDSALRQTAPPYEILVMNDGSTDSTAAVLDDYANKITVLWQPNRGVGSTLNALCDHAHGDLIAVLGSDDIWHPRYLETQRQLCNDYPDAVAYFTSHVDFSGTESYTWTTDLASEEFKVNVIPPRTFLRRYDTAPGPFACMSHCCIPKRALLSVGSEPFTLRMAEDLYFFNRLAPLGRVVFAHVPLTAYRVRPGSLSSDRVRLTESEVHAFELLQPYYREISDSKLRAIFQSALASKRRMHAKVLLGAGRTAEARAQLVHSIANSLHPVSMGKSISLLLLTYMPSLLQPTWPTSYREQSLTGKA